jgi:protein-S-isoprenylcysteine O-methyltransferase Ste14
MQKTSERGDTGTGLSGLGDVVKVIVCLAALVGAFAALSGRWDWWAGWMFLLVFVLYSVSLSVWLSRVDPGLARERAHDADERNQPYERVLLPVMVVLEIGLLVVAALDGGRFSWSHVPVWARAGGWMALVVGGAMLPWVFRTNTFASGVGRIQADRGHVVVSSGPYRLVRHPMYTAVIGVMLGLPLALGSWWALIPGSLLALLFVVRTALEDRMLQDELPGYKAYTRQTRYRLIPGIW